MLINIYIHIVLFVFPLHRVYKNDKMPYYNYVVFFPEFVLVVLW